MAIPSISSISPVYGNLEGGNSVVITGVNFNTPAVSSVKFGAANALLFSVDSDTQITATSPPVGAEQQVFINVTNADGTAQIPFYYLNGETIPTATYDLVNPHLDPKANMVIFGEWQFANPPIIPGVNITGGLNVGGGEEVFKDVLGSDLRFRTLVAGAGMALSTIGDTISIGSIASPAWELFGNVLAGGEFLGSLNAFPLMLKTNGVTVVDISPTQDVLVSAVDFDLSASGDINILGTTPAGSDITVNAGNFLSLFGNNNASLGGAFVTINSSNNVDVFGFTLNLGTDVQVYDKFINIGSNTSVMVVDCKSLGVTSNAGNIDFTSSADMSFNAPFGSITLQSAAILAPGLVNNVESNTLFYNSVSGQISYGPNIGVRWNEVLGAAQPLVAGNAYINQNPALTTFSLPVLSAVGDEFQIQGNGAGGWEIAQNAGQNIQVGAVSSSVGLAGIVSSTNQYDTIKLVCTVANTSFNAQFLVGTLNIL